MIEKIPTIYQLPEKVTLDELAEEIIKTQHVVNRLVDAINRLTEESNKPLPEDLTATNDGEVEIRVGSTWKTDKESDPVWYIYNEPRGTKDQMISLQRLINALMRLDRLKLSQAIGCIQRDRILSEEQRDTVEKLYLDILTARREWEEGREG